jgi:hypothetical protein
MDSLVLAYTPAVRDTFEAVPASGDRRQRESPLKAPLDAVVGTAGIHAWASWFLWPPHSHPPFSGSCSFPGRPHFRRAASAHVEWPPIAFLRRCERISVRTVSQVDMTSLFLIWEV